MRRPEIDATQLSAETDVHSFIHQNEHGESFEVFESIPFIRGGQSDEFLKLSLIRKVSPGGVFLANRGWIPTVPNSFGLPPGETCPGKTKFCEACYAFGSINNKGVKEMLDHNYDMLQSLQTEEQMTAYFAEMVQRYIEAADNFGVSEKNKVFRIHWSGDFYSLEYAQAWANVMRLFPHITFWAFTRSHREPVNVVPILSGVENLALHLSADEHNIEGIPEDYDGLRRANSAEDVVSARKLERSGRKTIVCPENLDRLKLMQDGEGACIKCRACFDRHVDIDFITSGKYDVRLNLKRPTTYNEKPTQIEMLPTPVRVNLSRYVTSSGVAIDE